MPRGISTARPEQRFATVSRRQRRHWIWWRDRARTITLIGLAIYAAGFFMDWPFELEASFVLRWAGIAVVALGAGAGLLWLLDDGRS